MFAPAQLTQTGANSYQVSHGNDKGLYVEFFKEPVHQEAESVKEGRQIYRDVDFIRIMVPGDRTKTVVRAVNEENDSMRFPAQWQSFKNKELQTVSGTPITEWPILTKSQALEFKSVNIHTVEQMSEVSDTALEGLGLGARDLREKARLYISKAGAGAELMKLQEENKNLRADIEALKGQFKELNMKKETYDGKKN